MEIVKILVGTFGDGSSVQVIDNLASSSTTAALSANQGRLLNETKANTADLAIVATSGQYSDLEGKPRYEVLQALPADLSGYPDGSEIVVTG